MTIDDWLQRQARHRPDHIGLVADGDTFTFEELLALAQERASRLYRYGVPANRRIGMLASNSTEMYLWLLAIQQLGVETVLLNHRLAARELQHHVVDACVDLILVDDKRLGLGHAVGATVVSFTQLAAVSPSPETAIVHTHSPGDVATIMYTSGTSGTPKGVMQTYGNHLWSAMGSMLNLGLEPARDSWVCAVPLFHISGYSILMRGLVYGTAVHLQERFDPAAMNDLLLSGAATTTSLVPQMLTALLADLGERTYPESVRCLLLGGGFIDDDTLARCYEHRAPVVFSFGMTETSSQCIALPLRDAVRKRGSAGLPLWGVRVRIDAAPESDGIGEIQLQSPTITTGYVNQQERYAAAFTEDGWFRTGDVGRLDDEGYLYVLARLTELIISGGENVYPSEIESVLSGHPGVREIAVVGRADSTWGQVPIAYVVRATADVTAADLLAHARAHLAHYKVPREIRWLDRLPRTASGKIRRVALLNEAGAAH